MSATARTHDLTPEPDPVDLGADSEATEYATRGARGHRAARPHLRMVSPLRPERASRGLFALIVTGLLGVGMVLILVINTSLAQGAFTISELKAEQAVLSQQEQTLAEEVAAAATPESLEQQARAMGMVPTETPVFLTVPSGEVLGDPKPAAGARSSVPRLLTPADATVTEAVDNGAAGLPVSPGADYDPAATDAAAAQAAAANAAGAADPAGEPAGDATGAGSAGTKTTKADGPKTTKADGAKTTRNDGTKADGKAAAKKKKVSENSLWQEATVIDMTGTLSSEDSGLVAVPVQ